MNYTEEEIIRLAIINEEEGYAFYNMATKNTEDEDIKQLFETLADQENQHREWLHKTFVAINSNKDQLTNHEQAPVSPGIFDLKKVNKIGSGELSSIHAAILLEKNSMDFYSKAAAESEHEFAQILFQKLAKWESSHMDILEKIYDSVRDDWWDRQRFSPA